jgi:hypothetical protein
MAESSDFSILVEIVASDLQSSHAEQLCVKLDGLLFVGLNLGGELVLVETMDLNRGLYKTRNHER